MEKSGSGPSKPQPLIIEAPSILRLRDRLTEVGITLFFWAVFLYMWQPLLSFLAWWFQGYIFYQHMITLEGYEAIIAAAIKATMLITIFGLALLLWARINQIRFRNKDRRGPIPDASLLEHALFCKVDAKDVVLWREYKQMVVTFGSDGYIASTTACSLAQFRNSESKQ